MSADNDDRPIEIVSSPETQQRAAQVEIIDTLRADLARVTAENEEFRKGSLAWKASCHQAERERDEALARLRLLDEGAKGIEYASTLELKERETLKAEVTRLKALCDQAQASAQVIDEDRMEQAAEIARLRARSTVVVPEGVDPEGAIQELKGEVERLAASLAAEKAMRKDAEEMSERLMDGMLDIMNDISANQQGAGSGVTINDVKWRLKDALAPRAGEKGEGK